MTKSLQQKIILKTKYKKLIQKVNKYEYDGWRMWFVEKIFAWFTCHFWSLMQMRASQ